MDFTLLLTAYAGTGWYAWRLFRDNDRVPTFCYFWAASILVLVTGAVYNVLTGTQASYVNGYGERYWVGWPTYRYTMLLAAVGVICVALGNHLARRYRWRLRLPEFIDARCPNPKSLARWAALTFLAGLVPFLATGALSPAQLIAGLLASRAAKGAISALSSEGGYFSFFNVFANLVPFGVAAVAVLFWSGRRPKLLLLGAVFFAFVAFASGTRSATAVLVAPFVLIPRYYGNRKLFRRLATAGAVAVFVIAAVQIVYRTVGYQRASLTRAVSRVNLLMLFDSRQLNWTAQAIKDYGPRFHYLHGQSYIAVAVNPVPRVFWHAKPGGYGAVNSANLGFAYGSSTTSGWLGEAYANFGWVGIPVVGLIAGMLMGILDAFVMRSGPLALAVLLPLQLRWIIWARGDSVFSFDPWLFGFMILAGTMLAVGPARDAGWQRRPLAGAAT